MLTILLTAPEPRPPQYMALSPIRSSTGLNLSYVSLSPPTMTHRVAASAPPVPPLTGASNTWTPRALPASAIRLIVDGSVVLRSKYAVPLLMPLISPPSPVVTSSTSCGRGREVNTTSLASAAARGLAAHVAPRDKSSSAASLLMSNTVISWPPLRMLRAMCRPMKPTPMKPTFTAIPPWFSVVKTVIAFKT